jgi:hypothetical protein
MLRKHGGLKEILKCRQAPAGFVKLATGEVTTTTAQRAAWKREADFIAKKKARPQIWGGKHFERVAVGSQGEEVKLHQRGFDGDTAWHRNRSAVDFLKRAGHPIATMNPALLSAEG